MHRLLRVFFLSLLLLITTFHLTGCQMLQQLMGNMAQGAAPQAQAQAQAQQAQANNGFAAPANNGQQLLDQPVVSTADILNKLSGANTSETIPQLQDQAQVAGADSNAAAANQTQSPTGQALKAGQASWYGPGFHGRKTANGETYNQNAMTAAMTGVPLGITVKVVRTDTGKSVTVRVNDRGPYRRSNGKWVPHGSRVIDLSKAAMQALGGVNAGVISVKVYKVG